MTWQTWRRETVECFGLLGMRQYGGAVSMILIYTKHGMPCAARSGLVLQALRGETCERCALGQFACVIQPAHLRDRHFSHHALLTFAFQFGARLRLVVPLPPKDTWAADMEAVAPIGKVNWRRGQGDPLGLPRSRIKYRRVIGVVAAVE